MQKILLSFFLCIFSMKSFTQSTNIFLDGYFEDWLSFPVIQNPGAGSKFKELSVTNDENYLFIRIQINQEILIQESDLILYVDGDNDPATGAPLADMGAEFFYHFGEKEGEYLNGFPIDQSHFGLISMPTFTSSEFEIRIRRDATPLGVRDLFTTDTIRLLLASDSGTDQIPSAGALSYTFTPELSEPYAPLALAPPDTGLLRIAAYNVRNDRPFSPTFTDDFDRLLRAIDADIFCFQEFVSSSASRVKDVLDKTLPTGTSKGWHAVKLDRDNVTLSRYPILLSFDLSFEGNATASLIDLPTNFDKDLLVINVHAACCSFDTERQLQFDAIAAFLQEVRRPGGRLTLPEGTSILIAGDLNLVGFQQQLHTLLEGDIQNTDLFGTANRPDWDGTPLAELVPLHTDQPLATTWRNPISLFTPGRLDYILYTDSQLEARHQFVLETNAMTFERLVDFDLQPTDTDFSDHLPVVADFALKPTVVNTVSPAPTTTLVSVFPNPFTERFSVRQVGSPETLHLRLFALDGRLVWEDLSDAQIYEAAVFHLPAGTYTLEVRQAQSVQQVRLIKLSNR